MVKGGRICGYVSIGKKETLVVNNLLFIAILVDDMNLDFVFMRCRIMI